MIEVKDRVPTYPGRVKLIPVEGQPFTYDMVRADDPVDPGTPINKALFESIQADLDVIRVNVSDLINAHAYKTNIANVPAGTEFVLFEGGIRVPFIKLAGEYGETGRSLVIRKNIYKTDKLATSAQRNIYENCKTDLWLNNSTTGYLSLLDDTTKAAITEVPVVVAEGYGSYYLTTLQRKAFLLSTTEFNFTIRNGYPEGTPVAYFSTSERRVAQYNGVATDQWTRTPQYQEEVWSMMVTDTGSDTGQNSVQYVAGIRPAFTLPANFEIDLGTPSAANVVATAEVI